MGAVPPWPWRFPTCDVWDPFLRVAVLSKALHHRSLESARGPLSSRKLLPPPIAAHLHPDEDRGLIPQRPPGRHPADVGNLRISNSTVGFGVFLISLSLSTVFLRHRACGSLPPKSPPGGCKFRWHTSEFAGTWKGFCSGQHAGVGNDPRCSVKIRFSSSFALYHSIRI